MCASYVEHLFHIFLDCNFAKACWRGPGLEFDTSTVESCSEWLLQILAAEALDKLVQVATILWGIWTARKMKVWGKKAVTPKLAM